MKQIIILNLLVLFSYVSRSQDHTRSIDDSMKINIDSSSENYTKTMSILDDISLREYEKLILDKTKDFSDYITLLTDHATTSSEAREISDLALKLFANDSCKVEVTYMKGNTIDRSTDYTIDTYLRRLRALRKLYDKIEVTWTNIDYVSHLNPGPDDIYYGVVTVQQTFRGFKDGYLIYGDITEKHIEVVLQSGKIIKDGKENQNWEIMLSDIGVEQTSSI